MKCPRRFDDRFEDIWTNRSDTCSYCGSMNPDTFIRKALAGEPLTPTDKNYKVYINGTSKFYFGHLSDEQMLLFVDALNAKKLNLEYPGYFYKLPYFIGS